MYICMYITHPYVRVCVYLYIYNMHAHTRGQSENDCSQKRTRQDRVEEIVFSFKIWAMLLYGLDKQSVVWLRSGGISME